MIKRTKRLTNIYSMMKQHVIRNRINRGWSVENTLMRKVGNYVYKN